MPTLSCVSYCAGAPQGRSDEAGDRWGPLPLGNRGRPRIRSLPRCEIPSPSWLRSGSGSGLGLTLNLNRTLTRVSPIITVFVCVYYTPTHTHTHTHTYIYIYIYIYIYRVNPRFRHHRMTRVSPIITCI